MPGYFKLDPRSALFQHLQQISLDFSAERRVDDLISCLSSDVTQTRTMLTNNLTTLLTQVLTLIESIANLLSLNTRFPCLSWPRS